MRGFLLASLLLTFQFTFAAPPLRPDPTITPGEVCDERDPDYSGRRYEAKISYCGRNVSSQLKEHIYQIYEIPSGQRRSYTIDHYIPLSIGGNNSKENLWPEHKSIKNKRPDLEMEVYTSLRDGLISQEEAIQKIKEAKMNPPLVTEE